MSADKSNNWFLRHKIISVFIVVFGLSIIAGSFSDPKTTTKTPNQPKQVEQVLTPEEKATRDREAKEKQKESLTKNIELLKKYQPAIPRDSTEVLEAEVTLWSAYAPTIAEAKASNDVEVKKLGSDLESALKTMQAREFPNIRKTYAELMKKKLWEEDIDVEIKGTGNSTLAVTGGIFAANKNKSDFNATLGDMLTFLRFKRIEYRWYKNASDYSYYDFKSKADNEI